MQSHYCPLNMEADASSGSSIATYSFAAKLATFVITECGWAVSFLAAIFSAFYWVIYPLESPVDIKTASK